MKSCVVTGALCATAVAAAAAPGTAILQFRNITETEAACLEAKASLGDAKVDTAPLDPAAVTKNWSDTCVSEPYCIIQPTSPEDVAQALEIISTYGVKFAVRSGGHSPNPGWSSIGHHGILIDMSAISQVSLSSDSSVASVGPGAYWGEVSAALAPNGVTAIGARAPYVGVGGLLLGGGYSFFASEYGLAVDNVKNYQVVLANGDIVDANSDENSDLFWGLKGGGPNFGIVTRIDLNTVPIDEIWYQAFVFLPNQAFDLLDALAEWQTVGSADAKSGMLFSAGLDSILVLLTYAEPTDSPAAFSSIYKLEPFQVAIPPTNSTLAVLHQLVNSAFPPTPGRHDYRAASSRIDAQLYKDVYTFWQEKAAAVHASTGANQTFVIQHISANVAQAGIDNGGNPLGLPQEDHQWWTTLADWEDEADDDLVRSVSVETVDKWWALSTDRGLAINYRYMNDASREQNPIGTYGAENIAKLKAIALKYDPDELFQTQQNNGFLLSKV